MDSEHTFLLVLFPLPLKSNKQELYRDNKKTQTNCPPTVGHHTKIDMVPRHCEKVCMCIVGFKKFSLVHRKRLTKSDKKQQKHKCSGKQNFGVQTVPSLELFHTKNFVCATCFSLHADRIKGTCSFDRIKQFGGTNLG